MRRASGPGRLDPPQCRDELLDLRNHTWRLNMESRSLSRSRRLAKGRRFGRSRSLVIEHLEERLVLDNKPFPGPLDLVAPMGSLIASRSHADRIDPALETDSYTIDLDAVQTVTAVFEPSDPSLRVRLQLLGPGATTL